MTFFKSFGKGCVLLAIVTLVALPAFARIPVRQTSDNGASSGVNEWTLLGRSVQIPLKANGKSVKATRQIICPNQDRENGGCTSGDYLYIFQLQSTSSNVNVNIGKLRGFVKTEGDGSAGTYGVMICDDSLNDKQLCTTDPDDPDFAKISGITFVVKTKKATSVTFVVPSFPSFPAGSTPEEGQGLTFYIKTHQDAPLPLPYPSLGIN
jgi:hypothetical protein